MSVHFTQCPLTCEKWTRVGATEHGLSLRSLLHEPTGVVCSFSWGLPPPSAWSHERHVYTRGSSREDHF